MVGWLFLNNPARLAQLLDSLESDGSDPSPPSAHTSVAHDTSL